MTESELFMKWISKQQNVFFRMLPEILVCTIYTNSYTNHLLPVCIFGPLEAFTVTLKLGRKEGEKGKIILIYSGTLYVKIPTYNILVSRNIKKRVLNIAV